jgi:enoyl-CoA hydratase/carnithine racemase
VKAEGHVFSSGHDLKELKASSEPGKIFEAFTETLLLLKRLPIVTLGAVNGIAAAGGLQLALSFDLLLATEKSTFSCPGVKWGLFCSTPGVQLMRTITSEKKGREMLLFGEAITSQEALQYGLVNKVLPDEHHLDTEINNYIAKLSKLSGEVIALGKGVLARQATEKSVEQAYSIATAGMCENILTKEDCKEGLAAFSEKRHPHFKN